MKTILLCAALAAALPFPSPSQETSGPSGLRFSIEGKGLDPEIACGDTVVFKWSDEAEPKLVAAVGLTFQETPGYTWYTDPGAYVLGTGTNSLIWTVPAPLRTNPILFANGSYTAQLLTRNADGKLVPIADSPSKRFSIVTKAVAVSF